MFSFSDAGSQYIHKINAGNFEHIALELFQYQYRHNILYRTYTDAIRVMPETVTSLQQIPFLPISFFKTSQVCTGKQPQDATMTFESSSTTGDTTSKHYVFSDELYRASLLNGFQRFYGDPAQYTFLALLPSYLERKNASLVHMADTLMKTGSHAKNGFYLDEWEKLYEVLQQLETTAQPSILIGVTFALLDFAAAFPMHLNHTIVMETGGMKGRREEWTRKQVHNYLSERWHTASIHSEYGMTELLSQAYARQNGVFSPAATMQVLVRDINDPLTVQNAGSGCLNIIDLANVDSCAFIATEDLGNVYEDGSFEVLGRMDHAALRGCSLMAV